MDPAGPWYYNRFANASASFQAGSETGSGDFSHQLSGQVGSAGASIPPTTSQLLLQAHSSSLPSSPFSTGFLPPSAVSYDSVFSPIFHHANPKTAHYSQHRALTSAVTPNKQSSESDLSNLREGYGSSHSQGLTASNSAYFDHQTSSTPQSSSLPWSQGSSQLPSPFGILPHESVVPSTTGAVSGKTASSDYPFHAFAVAQQNLAPHTGVDYKSTYSSDVKKTGSSQSSVNKGASTTQITPSSGSFFQPASSNFSSSTTGISSGFSPTKSHQLSSSHYSSTSKTYSSGTSSSIQQQQACIVAPGSSASKDYNNSQSHNSSRSDLYSSSRSSHEKIDSRSTDFVSPSGKNSPSIQTKAQSKVYPDLTSEQHKNSLESSQSSPISFAIMDSSAGHRYSVPSPSKSDSQSVRNGNHYPAHLLTTGTQGSSYRSYPATGENAESETYAGTSTPQNGPDSLNRRASPQASPLGHVVSPAYPMYNSPLASMPSPSPLQSESTAPCPTASNYTKSGDSQVAPRSPLDVSASRTEPSQYPSVIRSLNTPEPPAKNSLFPNDYDQQKACWDSSQSRSGKHYPATETSLVNPTSQRQYSESTHQSGRQDLSSCRGDPMSIVKNLHQHSTPQTASEDPKQAKRRKSSDKTNNEPADFLSGRVPPPAHLNATQQQQNGGFYDWNRPFGGTPNVAHTPYFSPLHVPTHTPSNEYQTAEATQYGASSFPAAPPAPAAQPASVAQPETGENPKVIVPDIEDELKFLSQNAPPVGTTDKLERKPFAAVNPSNDFMASYLKFLQGEPDAPSPPSSKSNRKQTWPKTKVYPQLPANPPNGETPASNTADSKKKSPDYDVQDDPRYFPLPKSRDKQKCLDSDSDSDSGLDRHTLGEVQSEGKKSREEKTGVKREKGRRGRPRIHPPKPPKKPKVEKPAQPEPLLLPPRRETSRRKAKEKLNLAVDQQENLDDFEIEVPDHGDSDSDPAWTPVALAKSSDDESGRRRGGRKGTSTGRKKVKGVGSADDASSGDDEKRQPKNSRTGFSGKGRRPRVRKTGSRGNSISGDNDDGSGDDCSDAFPFKSGEFVVIKTDLHEEWPPIWRVDGKTLLQKYEPFLHEGETLYRNISTYSGWSSDNKHIYRPIAVCFRFQNKSETLVEFLKDEMVEDDDREILEKLMKETEVYQDNFEVYVQTLISQALDSNFLTEIFQEQDEYFLSNVKKVDDITEERRQRFLSVAKWNSKLEGSVATWPCYNIMAELSVDEVKKNCAACDKPKVSARVLMYGQPYNSTTLEGSQPDPNVASDKDFLMCRLCAGRVELYNKVVHQKYLMFIECAKRVSEKRSADPSKDTTAILNDMLADEVWLNELFRKVRISWAEIDRMERYAQMKNKTVED